MTNGGMRLGKNGLENNNLRKREKERERRESKAINGQNHLQIDMSNYLFNCV